MHAFQEEMRVTKEAHSKHTRNTPNAGVECGDHADQAQWDENSNTIHSDSSIKRVALKKLDRVFSKRLKTEKSRDLKTLVENCANFCFNVKA